MLEILFVVNDPPYGNERAFNGLRLAVTLAKQNTRIAVFLVGEAVLCAHAHQRLPPGHYNIEGMLHTLARHEVRIGVCGSCLDARGIAAEELVPAAHRSSIEELAGWTREAGKILVF